MQNAAFFIFMLVLLNACAASTPASQQPEATPAYDFKVDVDRYLTTEDPTVEAEAIKSLQAQKVSHPPLKDYLKEKAKTKKPVIISMGMGGNKNKIKRIFSKNKITFCYCISEYPLDYKKINWRNAVKYDGFSDHTLGISAPIVFTLLKKIQNSKNIIIEKHVKLSNSRGPDAPSSINTDELSELVSHIRLIERTKL